MRHYKLEMIYIIRLGFVVKIDAKGALTARGIVSLPSSDFGFNKCAMATFTNSHPGGILNRLLPKLLAAGSDPDASDTLPTASIHPNHKGATEHFFPLDEIMADEVERG